MCLCPYGEHRMLRKGGKVQDVSVQSVTTSEAALIKEHA